MVKAALIASATPVSGQTAGTWSARAGAGRVHYERARQAARNAIAFENATRNGTNVVRSTRIINVVPHNQVRVVAFWHSNSPTNNENAPYPHNIHTNYDLRVRNHATGALLAESDHNSNIEIAWFAPAVNQLRIEVAQMANMHAQNAGPDKGSVTWVYDSLTTITKQAIPGITPPAAGADPVRTIGISPQYTGAVSWSPPVAWGGVFEQNTAYTATVSLSAL